MASSRSLVSSPSTSVFMLPVVLGSTLTPSIDFHGAYHSRWARPHPVQAGDPVRDHAEAVEVEELAETAAATGECHYQAELQRLRGTVLAEIGDTAEAAAWLQRAIDTARSQQARSLELRAATSLARLWRDQGKRTQAHDLLAPVYGWFTEGFDTADLKDAQALLDELA